MVHAQLNDRVGTPPGVFVTSIFAGAFAFSVGFDVAVNSFWDRWNQGVSSRPIVNAAQSLTRMI